MEKIVPLILPTDKFYIHLIGRVNAICFKMGPYGAEWWDGKLFNQTYTLSNSMLLHECWAIITNVKFKK